MSNSGLKKRTVRLVKTVRVAKEKLEGQSDELDAILSESMDELGGEDLTGVRSSFDVVLSEFEHLLIELETIRDDVAHSSADATEDDEYSDDE